MDAGKMKGGFVVSYNDIVSQKKELEEKLIELAGMFILRLD